jgi:hypothetical protein
MGRVSLGLGLLGWALLIGALVAGGLDPPPAMVPMLRAATLAALVVALVSAGLGGVGLVRGRNRLAAAIGLACSMVFVLYFTGFGFLFAIWAGRLFGR